MHAAHRLLQGHRQVENVTCLEGNNAVVTLGPFVKRQHIPPIQDTSGLRDTVVRVGCKIQEKRRYVLSKLSTTDLPTIRELHVKCTLLFIQLVVRMDEIAGILAVRIDGAGSDRAHRLRVTLVSTHDPTKKKGARRTLTNAR